MTKRVAIQMDPIESVDINADSTFAMALEAQERGYALWHYLPGDLCFHAGAVIAHAREMKVQAVQGNHYSLGGWELLDLARMDVVLMRQDPPFDMSYITATHILEHIHPATLVVNDPSEVRNAPEKLFVTHFPDFMPPTLITSRRSDIDAFRQEHREIIIKPLFGNGGAGVFHLREEDDNLGALMEMFTEMYREPVIVQKYLPEIRQGDKRIILIDGDPVGAVSRVPQYGESRANFHAGGQAVKAELSERDRVVCEALAPELRRRGLIFVGIDMIGDYLTEINVTSPTGIHEINRLDGVKLERQLWDAIDSKLATRG